MPRAVWKFPIDLPRARAGAVVNIEMPANATILRIGHQGGREPPVFFLWALVDPHTKDRETRVVLPLGTGHIVEQAVFAEMMPRRTDGSIWAHPFAHTETVITMSGAFVVHFWVSHPFPCTS